ncbi:MAG TPA: sulfite exporter TauE/SafE family protein [Candidatus Saccharimonadales bacterium]|nr:sulfite exporter TauE/SafE family protein [Candidatus Saccharimonadales bacterium]
MKQQTFPIKGMHCQSCEVLIAEELEALPDVRKAHVSLRSKTATITAKSLPPRAAVERAIKTAGYEIGYDENPVISHDERVYKDIAIGFVVVAILFIAFSRLGLGDVSNINMSGASIGLVALVIGLTAGFSTCMALIGGLVLGISSRHAEKHPTAAPMQKFRPHLFFNLGRILSFTILGGVIGALGAAFQLKGSVLGLLTIGVGIVMLMLGLQLIEVFPRLKGSLTLPSSIGKLIGIKKHEGREYSHKDSLILGAATFFLPCGFTQAMQLLAVSTGSWASGALIMGMFAVGTAPGLLGIGGLTSVVKGVFAQRFFRVVGVLVVAMALINFTNGMTLVNVKNWFPRNTAASSRTQVQETSEATQSRPASTEPIVLRTTYTEANDIVPSKFTVKVGQPTTLEVDVKDDGYGCMSTIMIIGLDEKPQYLKAGKTLKLTFTPKKAGTYEIACAMGVPRGTIKVEA